MDINVLAMAFMMSVLGFYTLKYFFRKDDDPPSQLPWVPIDVNKQRTFVNQTRDAGMFTERARRVAILKNHGDTFSYKGSDNGYLESLLTGIAFLPGEVCPAEPIPVIWSNGDADDDICDIVDAGGAFGGYDSIDFGGATANVCDV